MKTSFQSNRFAYFEIIFHPDLQMEEPSLESETGMNLYCLFPNHLVLQASSGLQPSELWAQIKEKEVSCLPVPVPAGRAGCSGVCHSWWLGLLRREKENRQKQPHCFYFCLSTPSSLFSKPARFCNGKPALVTASLRFIVPACLLINTIIYPVPCVFLPRSCCSEVPTLFIT